MYFSIIVDDGVGLLIADAGFFWVTTAGRFSMPTRSGTLLLIHELFIQLRHTIFCVFEVVFSAILWFLKLAKTAYLFYKCKPLLFK